MANNTNNANSNGNSKRPFWVLGLLVAITCVAFFVIWLKVLRANEGSEDALATAVDMGYDDFGYMQKDPDLDNVRGDARYVEFLEQAIGSKFTS